MHNYVKVIFIVKTLWSGLQGLCYTYLKIINWKLNQKRYQLTESYFRQKAIISLYREFWLSTENYPNPAHL